MAEVLDQEKQTAPQAEEPAVQPAAQEAAAPAAAPKLKKKKNWRKIIRRIIALVIVAALIAGGIYLWKRLDAKTTPTTETITEIVSRGSISSKVEGSGAAVAKNSASITLLAGGQVKEVFVAEGDYVQEGDPLYTIDSKEAQDRVTSEQKTVDNIVKQLDKLHQAASDLNVRADYTGILMDVVECPEGEPVPAGTTVATLVDNTKLLLSLYFSYAYENDIYVGQSATVSLPAAMTQISGTVHEIRKVQRVSPEGGQLFEVVIVMSNPGTLTKGMTATATLAGSETIYPYDAGELDWFRSKKLRTEIGGDCAWSNLYNYMPVSAGESVLKLTAESSETEIASLENQLQSAQKSLDEAKKSLESLNAFAPIAGTVLSVGIAEGDEVKPGTLAISIADTSTMVINANIDDMYVAYAKAGMPVNIRTWENEMVGVIESVSLTPKSENGVSRYPMVISVDNSEGLLMTGTYVNYTFAASQSDDCLVVPIPCVKSAQLADGESVKVMFIQSDVPPENIAQLAAEPTDVPEGFYPIVVETGISDNYNVELKSGAEEGMTAYAGVVQNINNDGGLGIMF